jgi:hypothetical protein
MSTDYVPLKEIRASDLFDGRLGRFKLHEYLKPDETDEARRCLSDGRNYVWVYIRDDGNVAVLTCYGCNDPGGILASIAKAFDTDIVSEHQPEFWGFDTQQEWDAYREKISIEHKEHFYVRILKHLQGAANDFIPGTVGMFQAQIAGRIVAKEPELMLVENKDRLLSAIDEIYEREKHLIPVTKPTWLAAHEDDLPQA